MTQLEQDAMRDLLRHAELARQAAADLPEGKTPRTGTVTVCLKCAKPSIYSGGSPPRFVLMTPEMLTMLQYTKPDFYRTLRAAQNHVRNVQDQKL